jgi:type IV pilus assembly protein PilA
MIVVAIIGILAAVAIPAFIKYVRRSKTAEALDNLRKIADGESTYFSVSQINRAGSGLTREFIAAGPTPAVVPNGSKSLGDWNTQQWRALNFAIDSPAFYAFAVTTGGSELTSSFTSVANGDLDGDSTHSTFERTGSVNQTTGDVEFAPGVYIDAELE